MSCVPFLSSRQMLYAPSVVGTEETMTGVMALSDEETRIVDPTTGGEKGEKLAQLGSVDPAALLALARVSGFGARKYDVYNYAKGYRWDLSINALLRHTLAFWNGEDYDEESGELHMAHAAWHALALTTFLLRGRGTDTRLPTLIQEWDTERNAHETGD